MSTFNRGGARAGAGAPTVAGEAKRQVSLQLTPSLVTILDDIAEAHGLSRSQAAQLLLADLTADTARVKAVLA